MEILFWILILDRVLSLALATMLGIDLDAYEIDTDYYKKTVEEVQRILETK